ncbi:ATP-binding protein [Catellatospora coxensis]|uniref:LuxR family transcriptional regulator n=1 Tax=Catellatospora coxensis TaxID=310354 RepID=A0A8J3L1M0_9ACTN|nr:LuxR family transcriptional regulator [Catellatospora coxensis]GIG10342.1 LuxR family transcriptional regulator [Catellatospora coxensis]
MEADRSDLVDRTAEREQLCAAARRAAAGHGNAVILEGSIGLGKSTLLDHLAEDCAALGMRVLHGAAADVEQRLPFAAVSAVARAHLGRDDDLDRVTALLRGRDALARSVTAVHHELAVTEELLALADRWLSRGPVAILLDDAQWADASSMVLLHRLARDIAQVPLLLVVAARAMAPGEALTALQRGLLARGALELRLEPLPEPAVVALARAQLGAQPGQRLRRLLRAHGGNPLHVKTLLRAYRADGLIQVADGAADLAGSADPPAVPQSLIELARGQAAQMPREYRETLQAAAVLGQTVDVAELSTVLEQPLMAVSEVIADALGTGLLVDDGHGLRFRQGLTRELLDRSVPQSVRTALHQRAGRMLTGRDGAPERVAAHLLAGGALGEDGLGWLAAHADALTVRAPDLAVRLLRRATADPAEASPVLRTHLVRALLWDGEPAQAERLAREVLSADGDAAWAPDLRWLLVQACYRQGRVQEAIDAAGPAVDSPYTSVGQAARFRGIAATCLFLLDRFDEAVVVADRAVADGEAAGDAEAIGIGYLAKAVGLAKDDMAASLALTELALAHLGHGIRPDLQVDPYVLKGLCLLELDRLAEAAEAAATAVRHNQRTGGVFLTTAHAVRAHTLFLQGHWDDALAEVRSGLDGPDPLGHAPRLLAMADLIAVHRGDAPGAELPADAGEADGRYLVRWAQALAAEAQGDPKHAAGLLRPMWEQADGLEGRRMMYRVCPDLARTTAAAGGSGAVRALADDLHTIAAVQPTPSLAGCAAYCRGLAEGGVAPMRAAADAFRQAGWPLYEAYAHESAALALAAAGDQAGAREALKQALDGYGRLEAGWDTARARARLRDAGVRDGARGRRGRPKHGWDALTDTERTVAELVATGMSNPDVAAQLFLSRRTVQSHVSSILAKLGVTSRVELAVAASQRQGQP